MRGRRCCQGHWYTDFSEMFFNGTLFVERNDGLMIHFKNTISPNWTYYRPQGWLGTIKPRHETGRALWRVGDILRELLVQIPVQTQASETQTHWGGLHPLLWCPSIHDYLSRIRTISSVHGQYLAWIVRVFISYLKVGIISQYTVAMAFFQETPVL